MDVEGEAVSHPRGAVCERKYHQAARLHAARARPTGICPTCSDARCELPLLRHDTKYKLTGARGYQVSPGCMPALPRHSTVEEPVMVRVTALRKKLLTIPEMEDALESRSRAASIEMKHDKYMRSLVDKLHEASLAERNSRARFRPRKPSVIDGSDTEALDFDTPFPPPIHSGRAKHR